MTPRNGTKPPYPAGTSGASLEWLRGSGGAGTALTDRGDTMTTTTAEFSTNGHPDSGSPPPGYHDRKADHLARLAKIDGQVRSIARMVNDERYCIDVLTQINAVTRALQQVALGLLDEHMRHCVLDAARSDPATGEAKLDELAIALGRTLRV